MFFVPISYLLILFCNQSLLGKAIMQSLQLYVFGPKNSDLFIKGKFWFGSDRRVQYFLLNLNLL